jgi:integrase
MKISIGSNKGWLRLRWQHERKAYSLNVGLLDSPTNRAYAQQIAGRIQFDILGNQFDPTLLKYRPRTLGQKATDLTVPELFKRFTEHQFKTKGLAPSSRRRYEPIQSCLEQRLNVPAHQVGDRAAGNYAALLLERLTARSAKERLWMLASCWDWAQGRYHVVDDNPWTAQVQRIKPQPSQKVKPFTATEIKAIIGAFRSSPHYQHYADFVVFLFGVGCRFGEAAGLRWKHVADDLQSVWIGESVSRGHRKSTKTGKARTVILSPMVAKMMSDRAAFLKENRHAVLNTKPDDLVFPSPKGLAIDDHNFRNRAWKAILGQCHIEYRKPYAVRHSVISHALANGANPMDLAEQTGHDKRVLLSTYAHAIRQESLFVEF